MPRIPKIAMLLAMLAGISACTVIPPQVAYTGPAVGVVAVRPAPYYPAPAPYYAPPPYRGYYGHRHGYGYRGW